MSVRVKFWGYAAASSVRLPTLVVYGGNTSCVEITAGEQPLIFDAGTGIRNLGLDFLKRGIMDSVLFLTHTHWDHINGFPFFAPAFRPGHSFLIMAGHLVELGSVQNVLEGQMANPHVSGAAQGHASQPGLRRFPRRGELQCVRRDRGHDDASEPSQWGGGLPGQPWRTFSLLCH